MRTDRHADCRICPVCGVAFTEVPALSREDNTTAICPDCGLRQALESIGLSQEKTATIIDEIHHEQLKNCVE